MDRQLFRPRELFRPRALAAWAERRELSVLPRLAAPRFLAGLWAALGLADPDAVPDLLTLEPPQD